MFVSCYVICIYKMLEGKSVNSRRHCDCLLLLVTCSVNVEPFHCVLSSLGNQSCWLSSCGRTVSSVERGGRSLILLPFKTKQSYCLKSQNLSFSGGYTFVTLHSHTWLSLENNLII